MTTFDEISTDTPLEVELKNRAIADGLLEQVKKLSSNVSSDMLDIAELLHVIHKGHFYTNYGYAKFSDWVDQGSGLEMSSRTAFYLTSIIEKSRKLGIPKESLRNVKISKLKEIFTLDTEKFAIETKLLLSTAESHSLAEIQEKVRKIAAEGKPLEAYSYMTLKIPLAAKTESFDPAIELVRRLYGDVPNRYTGEVGDISASYALELICQSYTQDPNNYEEPEKETILQQEQEDEQIEEE